MQNLTPQMHYVYHCGSDLGWSAEYFFNVPRTDADWAPHIAIFGDMGNENAQSLPRLQRETQGGMYDAIIHVSFYTPSVHTTLYICCILSVFFRLCPPFERLFD